VAACRKLAPLTGAPGPSTLESVTSLLDIPALAAGDDIQHPLLVVDVVTTGGEYPRTSLVFANRTGRITSAPFWAGRDEMVRGVAKGMLLQVVGKITAYRETLQLDATSVRPLPHGSVPLADLVPSVGPTDRYWQFIDETRARLTAPRLAAIVDLFYADQPFRERYGECPGAPGTGHHAAIGGLLQHTCEVVSIARQIARVARADEEVVVAGALLHDIGKTECYEWTSGVFETNARGRLVGHVVQGVIMLRDALRRLPPDACTADEAVLLEHLILSHHGKLEFGSPVRPLTLEAEVLHFADDASAKTASISDAYRSKEYFPGEAVVSARRVWQLDNRWLVRMNETFGRPTEPGERGEGGDAGEKRR
jgi:3'-5' exoribonuclease